MLEALLKRIPSDLKELPVAVIMGGESIERDFSLRSGRHIVQALEHLNLNVKALHYDEHLKDALEQDGISLCLLATHGVPGEDGKLQGYLESIGKYYSGASVAGSALSMNKIAAKSILKSQGIETPAWMVLHKNQAYEPQICASASSLGFPMVIKPTFGGSSIGVRLVQNLQELRASLGELFESHHHLFVEQYIVGKEVTVSALEDFKGRAYSLPVMELHSANLFYDYESKINGDSMSFQVPADISEEVSHRLSQLSLEIHDSLMQRDHSRSDFIISDEGQLYYLETNSIPGLTENSDLPAQAKAAGMTFEEVVISILMGPYRRWKNGG